MSTLQDNYINPFDHEGYRFSVLQNQQGEYSLWPEIQAIPAGWQVVFGQASRQECLDYVTQSWTQINPFAHV